MSDSVNNLPVKAANSNGKHYGRITNFDEVIGKGKPRCNRHFGA
jgi:hypothetical protein